MFNNKGEVLGRGDEYLEWIVEEGEGVWFWCRKEGRTFQMSGVHDLHMKNHKAHLQSAEN